MEPRFLEKEEYKNTLPLALSCFGDPEFMEEYYAGPVFENRVAVLEEEGRIVPMVQLRPFTAVFPDRSLPVHYILFVCTDPGFRHRGFMDVLMEYALRELRKAGEEFCFLVAVDKEIYRHLGFVHDWPFRPEEQDLLFADDGLTDCSARLLNGGAFTPPDRLIPAAAE